MLYLVFNEGHTATSALQRADLATEAIRLTRILHRLQPDDDEVTGLLALLLLTDARRAARTGPAGELIPLAEQVHGPRAGIALLDTLDTDERMTDNHRLAAVRAHLLDQAGDHAAAVAAYRAAAQQTTSTPERDYLIRRANRLIRDRAR